MRRAAAVTSSHELAASIRIVEPKLAITVEGPPETVVGQPSTYNFRVTNDGTGAAMDVGIDVHLADGLEAASGSKTHYNIGTLGPGQSRHVQMTISGTAPGEFALHGRALAGDAAQAKVAHAIRVVQPVLAVEMEGPKLRFVDRRAAYTIKVQNPGPAPIDNVQLLESIPEGFRFVEASSGGSFDRNAHQVAWFVGRLEANETATVGVQLIATEEGDHRLNAAAKADFGVIGEADTTTRVKGARALRSTLPKTTIRSRSTARRSITFGYPISAPRRRDACNSRPTCHARCKSSTAAGPTRARSRGSSWFFRRSTYWKRVRTSPTTFT